MVTIQCTQRPYRGPQTPQSKMMELQSKGFYGFFSNENWTPNVNLYETEGAYLVCVDLAGVEKDKIDIEVIDGRLRLRGKRAVPMCIENSEAPQARVRMHLMEIDHGAFSRDVELPDDVHHERISARYQDGLLWIDLPKKN